MKSITYRPGDILRETASEIQAILGSAIRDLTLERVVLGLFFSGVKLSNGAGGLCFTPIKSIPEAVCCPSSARVMPASGKLKGKKAGEFIDEMFSGNPLKRAMGIAVLNALSATLWKERPPVDYLIETGVNAEDKMDIPDGCYAIVAGAIIPVLKALKARGEPFGILEEDPLTLKPDEMKHYIAPPLAFDRIPQADVLIITGTTLINDTLERILETRKPDARVIVMGPTASMIPGAFIKRGVDLLGGVVVTDADRVLNVISEAGSGYHFFGRGAKKITIRPRKL